LVLAYFFSYLDRVNLGFAALTMNAELKFSPTIFACGAGIFFIGYFIFEVPSNLALEKFGASRWIARIMVTWGIISTLMALVSGVWSFYALRFLLGVAEAGFFLGRGWPGLLAPHSTGRPGQVSQRVRPLAGPMTGSPSAIRDPYAVSYRPGTGAEALFND
jgi:MFS family permease